MPDRVDACAKSVMEDNPDMSESRAFAICNAMENEGELEDVTFDAEKEMDEEDPCWDGYTMVGMKTENGRQVPNCVPNDDVPDANLSAPVQLAESIETEPIERVEESENQVRYKNLKLLSPGVWRDSASQTAVWYSPDGIKNLKIAEDNVVNIMHDDDNDVSAAGFIDPDSKEATEDGLYADVVLETDNAAGEYADENLQKTLETQGAKGFGGPSIELPADGHEVTFNAERGIQELEEGVIGGVGFVKNPASKPVSFARQTANRGVALSDGEQNPKVLERERRNMADAEEVRETLEEFGVNTEDMDDEELMDMAESMHDELMPLVSEGMENAEHGDDEEEDEEEEMDMEEDDAIDVVEEQIDDLWDTVDEIKETMMTDAEREELETSLAAADTVQELREEKEDLEKRLSELEAEPENPKTLAESENGESEIEGTVTPASTRDRIDGSIRR
jgi:hypothetical protein